MALKYVKPFKAKFKAEDGDKETHTLIWGEPCEVVKKVSADTTRVRTWGHTGTIATKDLMDEPLLEIYVIDVGQGDGILIHTPDGTPEGKWHLVDGGTTSEKQQLGKGAPNFMRWKFSRELVLDTVPLETVLYTHADLDHFGGLIDVLDARFGGRPTDPPLGVEVENFYHPGIAKFATKKDMLGKTKHGTVAPFPRADRGVSLEDDFITELLDGKTSFREKPERRFAEQFGRLAKLVRTKPKTVKRITHRTGFLPGYEPGAQPVTIRVLGPILEDFGTGEGLRVLGGDAVTVNGHSIVLRLDYGQAKILLTGDLNDASQRLLLSYQPEDVFAVDVGKGCHHGAEEVDLAFLKAMRPRATVISSGDNEGYSHPRPFATGASARYGREGVDATRKKERVLPPLVYSTELARSTKLEAASGVDVPDQSDPAEVRTVPAEQTQVRPGKKDPRKLVETPLVTGLIYGLVNVRTDGTNILCATKNEGKNDFDVAVFRADTSPTGAP